MLWLGTYVQTEHDDHDDVVGQGEIDIVHDQALVVSEARVGIDVGISRRFGASLVLPVRLVSSRIRYLDGTGAEVALVRDGIHHRNETHAGLGDPMVLGSTSGLFGPLRLTVRGGFTLPLGRTESDPFAAMENPHEHIQLGTGTVNPVLSLEASRTMGRWRLGVFTFTQQVLYENGNGYRAGNRYAAGIAVRRRLGDFSWRGGVEMQAETAERWGGIVHTDDGNRGRIDAMLAGGGSWAATRQLAFNVDVKVPFVTHVVGGQLAMPAIVELGVSWSFGATPPKPEAHEHGDEHEHGEHAHAEHEPGEHAHPDAAGLDVADLGAPGEAVDLVAVPGKLTLFDFWAAWCEPCKTLEPALVELVRKYPSRVALRRIDVVDWDSKAAARHLTPNGFDLPHVKIVDATGRLILERTSTAGGLAAMIDEIRKIVEAAQ